MMVLARVWQGVRTRSLAASLVAGSFLACGDPVSIRGDKSTIVLLALLGAMFLAGVVAPELADPPA